MTKTLFRPTFVMTALIVLTATAISKMALAQTPSLSLSSSYSSTTVGSTVTVYLTLNDSAADGSNLFGFDTNIYINNTYLKYSSTTPYTETFSGFGTSSSGATNTFPSYSSESASLTALEVEQDAGTGSVTNHGVQLLGNFTVQIIAPLPANGTVVSLGTTTTGSDSAFNGGSDLDTTAGTNVLVGTTNTTIVSAPEPSGAAVFLIGLAGLGLIAKWSRRRQNQIATRE